MNNNRKNIILEKLAQWSDAAEVARAAERKTRKAERSDRMFKRLEAEHEKKETKKSWAKARKYQGRTVGKRLTDPTGSGYKGLPPEDRFIATEVKRLRDKPEGQDRTYGSKRTDRFTKLRKLQHQVERTGEWGGKGGGNVKKVTKRPGRLQRAAYRLQRAAHQLTKSRSQPKQTKGMLVRRGRTRSTMKRGTRPSNLQRAAYELVR